MKCGFLCGLIAVAMAAVPEAGRQGASVSSRAIKSQVDLSLKADLAGDGQLLDVEFYHRGPLEELKASQPASYVRGILVRGPEPKSAVLDEWESEATSLLAFYPQLNNVWSFVQPQGALITAGVQYGGRVLRLYAFRWEKGKLKAIANWEAENFSIKRMGRHQQLVVTVQPSDYEKVAQLYAWNGREFLSADRQFPEYFYELGASYMEGIHNPESLPAAAFVQSCRLALQAFRLAGAPELGRTACLEAKDRIASGRGITAGIRGELPESVQREKDLAMSEIDALLKSPQPN